MNAEDILNEEIPDRRNAPVDFKITCPNNDIVTLRGRPCELSAFSHVPQTRKAQSADRSIYNSKRNSQIQNTDEKIYDYDRLFNKKYEFDYKVHRCDRKNNAKTTGRILYLDPYQEEVHKIIPTRWSGEYGKRQVKVTNKSPLTVKYTDELDPPRRTCTRIAIVQAQFFNRNGIDPLKQRGLEI